jgi:hypothetical protein
MRIYDVLAIGAIGASVGFMTGLSLSPIVSVVIESLLAVLASALAVVMGINTATSPVTREDDLGSVHRVVHAVSSRKVNLVPLSVVCILLALGTCLGITARTNAWFGARPQTFVNRWQGAGYTDVELRRLLLQTTVTPSQATGGEGENTSGPDGQKKVHGSETSDRSAGAPGVYSTLAPDKCDELATLTGDARKQVLEETVMFAGEPKLVSRIEACKSSECLALVTEILCPTTPRP